jgi:putative ABC transport system permease protein
MRRSNPNHVQQVVRTMRDLRSDYFQDRVATAWLLVGVAGIMVVITIGGIAGLGTYWVQQRRNQIGIRRALGARQIDIVGYFMLENALVVGCGVLIGAVVSMGLSAYMSSHFAVPSLRAGLIIGSAVAILVVGQLAALWPALNSAWVSPALAISSR